MLILRFCKWRLFREGVQELGKALENEVAEKNYARAILKLDPKGPDHVVVRVIGANVVSAFPHLPAFPPLY